MSRASTPDVKGTPGTSPFMTPSASPSSTPGGTPGGTPRSTPRGTPMGTPKGTPFGTPHGTPKSSRSKKLSGPQKKLEDKYRAALVTPEELEASELCSPGEEDPQPIEGELELFYTNPNFRGHDMGDGAFLNLGFSDLDDDKNLTPERLKYLAVDTTRLLEDAFENWSTFTKTINDNRGLLEKAIENRKKQLMEMIDAHISNLYVKMEEATKPNMELSESMLTFLDDSLLRTQSLLEGMDSENNADVNKHDVFKDLQEMREGINSNVPIWLPLELRHGGPSEYLTEHLFGSVQIVDKDQYPCKFSERVDLVRSFSIRTKFDALPCGVVDISINQEGDIIVADKNNKTLKVFDKNGQFKRLIGQGEIKDPTRVVALRHSSSILVTDNSTRKVKMYHKDGEHVCDFLTDLRQPTSLCENYKGDILVIEFSSRHLHIYNSGGTLLHHFKISLPNPTHMGVMPNGQVVVTDWRNHAVRAFHLDGELSWRYRDKGEGDSQMTQPQGICVDPCSNVIVADTSNHRIQVLNDEGGHLRTLIPKSGHGLRLPMVVKTNSNGLLYVGEYQGGIKIFKYLNLIDVPLPGEVIHMEAATAASGEKDRSENKIDPSLQLEEISLADNEEETSI